MPLAYMWYSNVTAGVVVELYAVPCGRKRCIRDQLFELSLVAENDVELNQFTPKL